MKFRKLVILSFSFVAFTFDAAFATEVDGRLRDECKYLTKAIEEAISIIEMKADGNDMLIGLIANEFQLQTLSEIYENLCD